MQTFLEVPTRPILQSLVSSHKADVFKCQSVLETAFMSVPYTCEYSHGKPIINSTSMSFLN